MQLAVFLTECCPAIPSDSLSIMLYRNQFPTALMLTECHTLFQISQLHLHCITDLLNTLDVATPPKDPISRSIHEMVLFRTRNGSIPRFIYGTLYIEPFFLVKGSIGQVWNPRVLYRTQRNPRTF